MALVISMGAALVMAKVVVIVREEHEGGAMEAKLLEVVLKLVKTGPKRQSEIHIVLHAVAILPQPLQPAND